MEPFAASQEIDSKHHVVDKTKAGAMKAAASASEFNK